MAVRMAKGSKRPTSEIQLEDSGELARGDRKVRAGFRINQTEILAGGIVEVEFFLEELSGKGFYLAAGGSRTRWRPAFFEIQATLEGHEIELSDPFEKVPELGGPATSIQIEPHTRYQQTILVNEFVRLEKLSAVLVDDENGLLRLNCRRPLPLADTSEQSFEIDQLSPTVEGNLSVKVRRDDAALESFISRLTNHVRADRGAMVSADREANIAKLGALRSPMALPYLQSLANHPDPVVQLYVTRAITLLNQESSN